MDFQVLYYYVTFIPYLKKKNEKFVKRTFFIENINNITQADAMAIFGLAVMVDSKWKHFTEVEVRNEGWMIWVLLC